MFMATTEAHYLYSTYLIFISQNTQFNSYFWSNNKLCLQALTLFPCFLFFNVEIIIIVSSSSTIINNNNHYYYDYYYLIVNVLVHPFTFEAKLSLNYILEM